MRKLLLVLVILFIGVPQTFAQDSSSNQYPPVALPNTEAIPMSSSNTGGEYTIFIALPGDYKTASQDTRYPVVYLLDADFYFGAVNDFIRVENLVQELPNTILVGIGYAGDPLEGRVADMLQNPDHFLGFLGDELIPFIDEQYRTEGDPQNRTLIGHSLGGQFVLYTLFNRPELFTRYVAASPGSPTWEDMFTLEEAFASEHTELPVALFMSASDSEPVDIEPMFSAIQSREYEGLESTFRPIENATHGSSSIPAFTYGLRYVYQHEPATS